MKSNILIRIFLLFVVTTFVSELWADTTIPAGTYYVYTKNINQNEIRFCPGKSSLFSYPNVSCNSELTFNGDIVQCKSGNFSERATDYIVIVVNSTISVNSWELFMVGGSQISYVNPGSNNCATIDTSARTVSWTTIDKPACDSGSSPTPGGGSETGTAGASGFSSREHETAEGNGVVGAEVDCGDCYSQTY